MPAAAAGAAPATARPLPESERGRPTIKRDATWFAQIYEGTVDRVYRFAWVLVKDPDRAEDVTAETYLKAWNARHTLKNDDRVLSWLMTIAHNCAYSDLRSRRETLDMAALANHADTGPDAVDGLEFAATLEQLRDALLQLTIEQQQVIFLRFFEGSSHDEVAREMNRQPNAIRAIQFRALKRLRRLLDSEATSG
jgi:RNA polymerase sigma-70 factor (ECF subfamily)